MDIADYQWCCGKVTEFRPGLFLLISATSWRNGDRGADGVGDERMREACIGGESVSLNKINKKEVKSFLCLERIKISQSVVLCTLKHSNVRQTLPLYGATKSCDAERSHSGTEPCDFNQFNCDFLLRLCVGNFRFATYLYIDHIYYLSYEKRTGFLTAKDINKSYIKEIQRNKI